MATGLAVRQRTAYGTVTITRPVAAPPGTVTLAPKVDKATAYPDPVMDGGRPTSEDYRQRRAVAKPAGYEQVWVGGVNVTFAGGVETVVGDMTLTEPFAYGPTSLGFPGIDGGLDDLDTVAPWAREDAAVVIQRVDDPTATTPTVLATDYRGFVAAVDVDGRNLSLEVGGQFSGPASSRYKQDVLVRRVKDLGFWFANIVETLGLGLADRDGPTTGIQVVDGDGGSDLLSWAGDVCAWSQTAAGVQRTIMPTVWGGNVWGFAPKDTTTKHVTLFTDDARVVASLRRDRTQTPTTWYGTGTSPDGVRWRNARYPGVFAGPAPTFPGTMSSGDTGDGVIVLNQKLVAMGFLEVDGLDYGTYGASTVAAVRELQDRTDLTVNGVVNSATWNALFDVTATGPSLSDVHIAPLVQASAVRRYNYTSNGSISGLNANFRASVKPVERFVNFGPDTTKAQAITWCRGQQARLLAAKNWTGTITLNGGFGGFVGEWAKGSEPTGADIMSQLDIRPGMNAWLPMFDGGTLVHVSGVQISRASRTVTLTVDTMARDLLEVAAINVRNKDAARHIRREWSAANRPAKASGGLVARDEYFGVLDRDVALNGNQWNIVYFPAGQAGMVNAVDVRVTSGTKFAVAFLSRDMTVKKLRRVVPNPLTTAAESVWETNSKAAQWIRNKTLQYASGDGKQPCGYFPRRHRDDDGNVTDAPITGEHYDAGTPWAYECLADKPAMIAMAIYPDGDCTLKRGQILWAQLDDAV